MKVTEHFAKANKTLFSFEILPPLKGENIQKLYDHLDPLMEFNPPFIDVTYHREEFTYKKRENGLLERQVIRKRPGTVGICAAIKNKYNVDTVPHLICGGFTKEETENALIDLHFLGINNVLVLRGDAMSSEARFVAEENGHNYASELLEQVSNMNAGKYLDDELTNAEHTDFCIGVAGYPEKHFEAPNIANDLKYLKLKVDMGAQYIVTQMFFDNEKFFSFVKKCREIGINVPIIPGLKPITTLNHLSSLPRHFYIDLPDDLVNAVEKCKTNAEVREVGVEWAIHQSKELIDFGVPSLHFYSMGKAEPVRRIASALF
ncbi:methylenetetrahydrofolate reductase [NAD(P)H] [Marinigracilibium pacificum]|uniref:Methylenetetrahydrofolate reductase n=1 Tax=Marinigracilibium pacificum TaxID=2729599 RepID=A0A848J426_9BACT|nr:methylenetetrahydrofolate reductase [NAD(P)H] [Marinigracilibium pacificum]NMM49234.1 methylenetetrahydrofolate reductase [NAD(P)H] [Marinigracilibium pacificum]